MRYRYTKPLDKIIPKSTNGKELAAAMFGNKPGNNVLDSHKIDTFLIDDKVNYGKPLKDGYLLK